MRTGEGSGSAPPAHPTALTRPMKVAVVSRVRLYREGLALILGSAQGLQVTGTAGDGAEATDLIAATTPSVAIVDAALVTVPGLLVSFRGVCPPIRVVAFGVRDDVAEIVGCAEAGVSGYVASEAGAADLIGVLDAVQRNEVSCTPFVAATLLRRVNELAGARYELPARVGAGPLTAREAEIMALVELGLMNKQIARRLGISLSTVKNHVHRILQKKAALNRGDLARRQDVGVA
ncbi:MAG TPA: response regulator transcription factor [Actinoplanes sp.]|jgi:DNA-binding NarL/FixJ family response regulator